MGDYKEFDETLLENGVLKNKLGITDERELRKKEYTIVAKRSLNFLQLHQVPIENVSSLYGIHYFVFSPLYDWAGKRRNYPLSKGQHSFMDYHFLDQGEEYINSLLSSAKTKDKLDPHDYAELLDSINDLHPFREGNGRSCKLMIQTIAIDHHQVIDYSRNSIEMIKALEKADTEALSKQIHLETTESADKAKDILLQRRRMALRGLER